MKKATIVLMVTALFTASVPTMALAHNHQHDERCQKDCEMLVRNCGNEVDSLPQKIQKLQSAISNNADKYSSEQLSKLKSDLEDTQEMLATIERGGH